MIFGGWKKPLFGFLFVNLIIFWLFYFSEFPFSYLYEDGLRDFYLTALLRESLLYFLIFFLFPDDDLRYFQFKGEKILYFISIFFLLIELFTLDFNFNHYNENTNRGTTLFELGALIFVISSWRSNILSLRFILGVLLVIFITVLSGKRMAFSFIFMRLLYNSSLSLNFISYFFLIFVSFLLLTISSFFREGIFDFSFIITNGILSSNHGGVLHAAGVYLEAEKSLDYFSKFKLFFYNLIAPWFVSLNLLPLEASINNFFIDKFRDIQGNGGFISSYLKFFGVDYFMILLLALLVKIKKSKYIFKFFVLSIFIVSNRFFYYNLASSIRLFSLTILIYLFVRVTFFFLKLKVTN